MKWKCPNCFLRNEFNSIKGYTNHMRLCTSNGNNKNVSNEKSVTSSGNSNIQYHPLECRDIIDDDEEELSTKFKTRINQSNPHDSPCIQSNNLPQLQSPFNDNDDNFHEEAFEQEMLPILPADNKYISFQRKFLSIIEKSDDDDNDETFLSGNNSNRVGLSSKLTLGHVEAISNSSSTPGHPRIDNLESPTIRGHPDPRDVLDIFIFCKSHYLTAKDGNDLIILIIQLFRRHPTLKTLFLHRNMRSINKSIDSAIDSLYSSNEIHATLPFKLRGSTTNQRGLIDRLINKRNRNPELIIASGIGLDPMELLAEFAVSHDFDFFDFDPILDIQNGVRQYSTFASAKLYEKIHKEVADTCGIDVKPFCFQYAVDATPVASGGVGNKSVTPVNMRCLQVKTKTALQAESNTSLIGFTPTLTVSKF